MPLIPMRPLLDFASASRLAMKEVTTKYLMHNTAIFDLRDYLKLAMAIMQKVYVAKMRAFGSAGWADIIPYRNL